MTIEIVDSSIFPIMTGCEILTMLILLEDMITLIYWP